MAKHCDVCNNSYPETEAHCPHCAAAAESAVDLGEPVVADLADSNAPVVAEADPPSEDSVVAWSELVEEAEPDVNDAASIDSPSDVDLLAHSSTPVISDSAVGGEPFVAEIASGVDLPGATVTETPAPAQLEGVGSDSAIGGEPFVAEIASGVDLGGGVFVADVTEEEQSSAIDLGALARGGAAVTGRPDEAPVTNVAEEAGASDAHFLDEVAEVEAGSAVNLGAEARATERPSSRDLIAEAVESGVNLGSEALASEDVTEPDAVIAEADDSAVDLGSAAREKAPSSAPEAVPERRKPLGSDHDIDLDSEEALEHVDLAAAHQDESVLAEAPEPGPGSSGVDLGGTAGRAPKRPLSSSSSSLNMENEAAEAAEDEEEEKPVSAKSKQKKAVAKTDDEDEAAALLAAADAETEAEEAPAKPKRRVAADEDEDEEAVPARAAKKTDEDEEEAPAKGKRPVVDGDEHEDKPAPKPPKARSGAGCLVVGGVLGLLIGAIIPIALSMFNVVDPAKELGALFGMSTPAQSASAKQGTNPGTQKPPEGLPTVADAGQHLKNGDFAKAVEGLSGAADSDEVKAQRGTARWMNYLQDQMGKGAKPNAADEPVQKAREELTAAAAKDNPEAILALGNLQEYTTGPAEAMKTYQDGLVKFAGKPNWVRIFQAQIDRLDSTTARPADVSKPQAAAPLLGNDGDVAARALVVLLIAFQTGEPAPADKGPEEAGFDFWAAVKLAQSGKYPDAVKQLEAARVAHEKLRFSRLRKAQNPLSDPTEEIFLRSADEIKAYWTLQSSLAQQGIAGRTPAEVQKAIAAIIKQQTDEAALLKDIAGKLKTTPDKAVAGIDMLAKERDDASKKAMLLDIEVITVKKDAETARKEAKETGDKLKLTETKLTAADKSLKAIGDRLETAGIKGADLTKGVDTLATERAAADKTLNAIVEKLAGANAKVERKDVLQGVDRVVEMAKIKDPKGELMASREEVRHLGEVLDQSHTPEQMIDIWLPIVADRARKSEATKASVDAQHVRDDPRAPALARKKATAVLGLAQRDLGAFENARKLLTEALAGPEPKTGWQAPVAQALKELTDLNAYYLPQARELYEAGKDQEAMLAIAQARKLFPKDGGNLLALSALVQLDMAREKGKIDPASPTIIEAKRDAEAAVAAGSAEGHYVLGRINEELGNLAEAKAAYAKALTAHGENDEAGARYRLALARVLKLQGDKPGGRAAAPDRSLPVADMTRQPLMTLLLLVELGMQPGGGPNQDEANKLLEEVLNAKDGPDTFMLKAQAEALRGLWTPALKIYVAGLRPHIRRDYADGLANLIEHHPALRRPPSMDPPNPLLADASYSSGLRHYFARRYSDAEAAFIKAIEYDNQDARYFYFLGLSRMALDKNMDADADFREGAQLELLNRPGREAVSTALERVQGNARQTLNRVRP